MPRRASAGGTDAVPTYNPQLARLARAAPDGDDWLHEMKYDGYRIGCQIKAGAIRRKDPWADYWTSRQRLSRAAAGEFR